MSTRPMFRLGDRLAAPPEHAFASQKRAELPLSFSSLVSWSACRAVSSGTTVHPAAMIPRYAATQRGWLSATMASRDPRANPFLGDPSSDGLGHPAEFGVGAALDLILALQFERDIVRPALRAFDKTVIESGHESWGIYTKIWLTAECSEIAETDATKVPPAKSELGVLGGEPCQLFLACSASKYARLKRDKLGQFSPSEGFHGLINTLIGKVFGTKNERVIKSLMPKVEAINALEPQMQKLTDAELRAKTDEFRQRIQERLSRVTSVPQPEPRSRMPKTKPIPIDAKQFEKEQYEALQEVLDEILVEAFAVVREAGRRVLNMRHFDVQLIGGMVQHKGMISEMKTGEGKTLVATLPVYLNALSGRGVHVVTVNDYLAKRDSEWMGKLYRFLGLTVGVIVHDLDDEQRRAAYAADVTYGTNNEFGFDYLRDNMKFDLKDCVQRGHNFAIVDEVDSILIDEARTPLIISGASEESTDKYYKVNRIIPKLEKGEELEVAPGEPAQLTGDFVVDEKHRNITVTDEGWTKVEGLLGIGNIADPENWPLKHHVETAVKAHALYRRDVEYVVKDGEVIIVDEFTGRMMPGRRWSDGLHQAIEAKEGVKIERENQTLATITFQNYFRMFKKLSGMTGTAETEAAEFDKIYKLDVVVIPTNKQMLRLENPDVVFRTEKEKYFAVADEIQKLSEKGQPVLVGTTSMEKSERLSDLLKKKGLKQHVVLNAKFHEREAEFVAQAGRKGMVTIATNMAGRGTDILLGGNPEFMAKQEMVKKGIAQQLRVAQGKIEGPQEDGTISIFYYNGNEYTVPTDKWTEAFEPLQGANR